MPNSLTVELPEMPMPPGLPGDMGSDLPLRGVTVLVVEDSRFASEALRMMCRRLGARLRRADSLGSAASHLRLYRPDVVFVDLGLPDGRGEALIRDLAQGSPRPTVVLGMSGDLEGRGGALAAGADGFVDKPLESLATVRDMLLRLLPDRATAGAAMPVDVNLVPDVLVPHVLVPDALALRDDLAHAAALLDGAAGGAAPGHALGEEARAYVAGFVRGVARHAHDTALAEAAGRDRPDEMRALLEQRLQGADQAFGKRGEVGR